MGQGHEGVDDQLSAAATNRRVYASSGNASREYSRSDQGADGSEHSFGISLAVVPCLFQTDTHSSFKPLFSETEKMLPEQNIPELLLSIRNGKGWEGECHS